MTAVKNTAAALVALAGMTGQLAAAPSCASNDDMAAFRTAAVQQQLMVAALTCHAIDAYNRFVIVYRPELQKSDSDLKTYFIRQGSEAAYDTFKTKLANLSSLSDLANGPAYCANAAAAFDIALKSRQPLASFVADQRLMIALPKQTMCAARTIEASARPPVQLASAKPTPFIKPAPVRMAAAPVQGFAVEGVPAHALPASPYGDMRSERAAQSRDNARDRDDYDDDDLAPPPRQASRDNYDDEELAPPPPRRVYQASRDDYDDEELAPPPPRPERPRITQSARNDVYRAPRRFDDRADDEYYAAQEAYPPRWAPRGYQPRW